MKAGGEKDENFLQAKLSSYRYKILLAFTHHVLCPAHWLKTGQLWVHHHEKIQLEKSSLSCLMEVLHYCSLNVSIAHYNKYTSSNDN